jgi:cyclic pyranopterin monophosphate synthase
MERLTHIASDGSAKMVDVSAKPLSHREAVASGRIELQAETLELIASDRIAKGNVFATARLAGIQAAKQTAQLIPLCHTLGLSHVEVGLTSGATSVEATCIARTTAQTGVEMEALTGVSVALLAIYDMCKAVDKQMRICDVQLLKKTKFEPTPDLSSRSGEARRGTSQLK